ncbi:MAG: Glutaredoxin [Planctomycetaceae bacterium]|nr:Glutaredoxin [Planctomycetaceae bacterium]
MSEDFHEELPDSEVAEIDAATGSGGIVHDPQPLSQQVFGTAAIYLGATLLLIAGCETFGGQLSFLPRFWYVNRTLWIGFGILLIPAGVAIQSLRTERRPRWKPTRLGRRFDRIRVYSRAECHLCDVALELLADSQYAAYLPPVEVVDIDADPELRQRFGQLVPAVEFDGKIRFTGRIDEILLRRLIEGTHPVTLECHRPR